MMTSHITLGMSEMEELVQKRSQDHWQVKTILQYKCHMSDKQLDGTIMEVTNHSLG